MECFEVLTIVSSYPMSIESLSTNDKCLLLSTKSGQLFTYTIEKNECPANKDHSKWQIELLRSFKNFSKTSIKKIISVPSIDILVCLTEDMVYLYSMDKLNTLNIIPLTKGAKLISINYFNNSILPSLSVVLRRKVIFYQWNDGEFIKNSFELNLNETPRAIIWLMYRLVCVGLRKDYILIKPDAGKSAPLFNCGKKLEKPILVDYGTYNPKNIIIEEIKKTNINLQSPYEQNYINNGQHLDYCTVGLQRDEMTINIVLDKKGSVIKQYIASIWSDVPVSVVASYPYIMAIVNTTMEIASLPLDLFSDEVTTSSKLSQNGIIQKISLLNNGYYPYKIEICNAFKRKSFTNNNIINSPNGLESDTLDLPSSLKYNNKVEIFVYNDRNVFKIEAFSLKQQINRALNKRNYPLAIQLVDLITNEKYLQYRISKQSNIRNIYAFDLFCNGFYLESLHLMSELDTDPIQVIALFPDLIPLNMKNSFNIPENLPKIDGGQRDKAIESLITYLTPKRKIKIPLDKSTVNSDVLLQIIDTTLLKCYLEIKQSMIAPLIRLKDNHIMIEEIESLLISKGKYNELILLYQNKNHHSKALKFIDHMIDKQMDNNKTFSITNLCDYLKNVSSDYYDLIEEYLVIIRSTDASLLFSVVTDENGLVELWPRKRVYQLFNETTHTLKIAYLEHIIFNWHEVDQQFTEELLLTYLNQILEPLREYYKEISFTSNINQFPKAGTEVDPIGSIRKRFLLFLELNNNYDHDKLLDLLPLDILLEERAILLGKKSIHRSALAIFIFILNDYYQAEIYSLKVYENFLSSSNNYQINKTTTTKLSYINESVIICDIYFHLIQLCISQDSNQTISFLNPFFKPVIDDFSHKIKMACSFINKHIHKLSIDHMIKLIESLPVYIQFDQISKSLINCLHKKNSFLYSSQVNRHLLLSNYIQITSQRIHNEKQSFSVSDSNRCLKCFKRIGVTAFIRLNDGQIIHSYCSN